MMWWRQQTQTKTLSKFIDLSIEDQGQYESVILKCISF